MDATRLTPLLEQQYPGSRLRADRERHLITGSLRADGVFVPVRIRLSPVMEWYLFLPHLGSRTLAVWMRNDWRGRPVRQTRCNDAPFERLWLADRRMAEVHAQLTAQWAQQHRAWRAWHAEALDGTVHPMDETMQRRPSWRININDDRVLVRPTAGALDDDDCLFACQLGVAHANRMLTLAADTVERLRSVGIDALPLPVPAAVAAPLVSIDRAGAPMTLGLGDRGQHGVRRNLHWVLRVRPSGHVPTPVALHRLAAGQNGSRGASRVIRSFMRYPMTDMRVEGGEVIAELEVDHAGWFDAPSTGRLIAALAQLCTPGGQGPYR